MNNMLVRAISGAVYIGIIIACTLLGFEWFGAMCVAFAVLALNELERLLEARASFTATSRLFDYMAVAALFMLPFVAYMPLKSTLFTCMLFGSISYITVYIPLRMCAAVADSQGSNPARGTMASFFSLLYTTFPLLMLAATYIVVARHPSFVLMVFIMIWLNDTGAYLSGRAFGRRKLCERLSPKKTWEGFWGGFFLCVAGALCYPLICIPAAGWIHYVCWGVFGALVSAAATMGDLFESLIKRTLGVKDSGQLIPGHGGILDRIDSLLAVAPIALLFAFLWQVLNH